MQARINLVKDDVTGKLRLEVEGSKIAAILGVLAITVLIFALTAFALRVPKAYSAYEGTLVEVKNDWLTSWFGDEGYPRKCIVLEDKDGQRFRRYLSEYTLFQHRIEKGDYVVKKKGFFENPRARDKKTMAEMLESYLKMVK